MKAYINKKSVTFFLILLAWIGINMAYANRRANREVSDNTIQFTSPSAKLNAEVKVEEKNVELNLFTGSDKVVTARIFQLRREARLVDVGDQYSTTWSRHAVRRTSKYGLMAGIYDKYRTMGYSHTYLNLLTQEDLRGDEESPSLGQAIYTLYNPHDRRSRRLY